MTESTAEDPAAPPPLQRCRQQRRQRLACALALGIVLLVSVLHRFPPLINARAIDSDAAVPALEARHLLRGEFSWYLWGAGYQGSLVSLLLAGVFLVFGSSAQSVIYSVFAMHLLANALVFDVLRRRLADPWRAAICVLPLAVATWPVTSVATTGSPRQAPFTLLFLAIWLYDRAPWARRPGLGMTLAGIALALAIWGDLMSLVFVPGIGVFAVMAARDPRGTAPMKSRWIGLAAGAVVGLMFLIPTRQVSEAESKEATHRPARIAHNAQLLWNECLPFTLGTKIMADPDDVLHHHLVRAPMPTYALQWIGGMSLLALTAAGGILAFSKRTPPELRRLGLLGAITSAATLGGFLTSVMPEDVWAARYLAPIVLAAPFALAPVAGRVRTPTLAILLAPYLLGASVAGWIGYGPMVRGLVPQITARGAARDEMQLAQFLRERNIRYAKANYWLAYRLTFLWDENPIVVPLSPAEDRYRPWRQQVESARLVAAIFHPSEPRAKPDEYEQLFRQLNLRYERHEVAGFTVLIVEQR